MVVGRNRAQRRRETPRGQQTLAHKHGWIRTCSHTQISDLVLLTSRHPEVVCVCVCARCIALCCMSLYLCVCLLCLPVYLYVPLCVCVCVYVCVCLCSHHHHTGEGKAIPLSDTQKVTQDSSANSPMGLHMLTLLPTRPEMLISTQMYPHQSSHSFKKHLWSTYCVPGHLGPQGGGQGGNTAGLKPLTPWVNSQQTQDTGACEGYCDEKNQRK